MTTSREFLESRHIEGSENRCKAMIEFAKLHCMEQAKVISENVDSENCFLYSSERNVYDIVEDSILNSYDLNDIK